MNPKYSLRAFAKKLSLSPSKVSEVLSGKKRLGVERAEDIAKRLGLSSLEKELFVLSVRLESSSKNRDREELAKHARALSAQLNAKRTSQKNAWYFGAIKALVDARQDGVALDEMLGITRLQVENAKRFIRRIAKIYPDRKQISIEPLSILRKVEDHCFAGVDQSIEADFLFLSQRDKEDLEEKIKSLIKMYKLKSKNTPPEELKMIYWGSLNLNHE